MRVSMIAGLLIVLLVIPAVAETAEERKSVAVRAFEEILGHGKFELVEELYAKDFVNHGMSRNYTLAEDMAAARDWRSAAPDSTVRVDKVLIDGEFVTVLWYGEGTNTGVGKGLPATGKKAQVRGITIWRIADGKIREEWSSFDQAAILVQLGLLVPAAKAK